MKVQKTTPTGRTGDTARTGRRERLDGAFSALLDSAMGDEEHKRELRRQIEAIVEQGKRVADRLAPDEMAEYRRRIQAFVDTVLHTAHKLARERFVDHDGSHRVYSIVQKVDEDLAALAEGVLDRERARLRIVSRTVELRGLLLDIVG